MSGSIGSPSPLALAMMGNGPGGAGVSQSNSPMGALSPNAVGLQQQFGSMPWYAVPGMFQQAPTPAVAPGAAAPPGAASQLPQDGSVWTKPQNWDPYQSGGGFGGNG